ncbi:MAG: hypothetical protein R3B06_27190 [Kofleriaceae bacterium]
MRLSSITILTTVTALATLAAGAAAEPVPLTLGARVGGYGFRNPSSVDSAGHVAWDQCRMNGLGVFARRGLGRFFTEGGADFYFSERFPQAPVDAMGDQFDRLSGLITVAAGANVIETRRFVGYAQLGAGLELTRFTFRHVDDVMTDQRALPVGFVGFGGEVRVGQRTRLGANLRAHLMGNFTAAYQADRDVWDPETNHLEVSPEAAAQGQFYVSYAM